MKKILIALFTVALVISLATFCAGAEPDGEFNIKEYAAEKIAPVAVGVITSIIAVIGALQKIKSTVSTLNSSSAAIKELKEAADSTLSGIKAELHKGISDVYGKIKDVPEIKEGYSELLASYNQLKEQNAALLEAIKTGFEAIPQAVESGAASKIAAISKHISTEE